MKCHPIMDQNFISQDEHNEPCRTPQRAKNIIHPINTLENTREREYLNPSPAYLENRMYIS